MKKQLIFICTIIFFSCTQTTSAQNEIVLDSLQQIYNSAKTDSNRVDVLINICKEKWKYAEYLEAKKIADEALLLAQKINYKTGIANAYNQIGIVFWYVRDNKNALDFHFKSLAIFKETGNLEGLSELYNRLGHDYADLPDYPNALIYFEKALSLDYKINNQIGIAKNLDLIGYVYMNFENYDKALQYYFEALKIAEATNNKRSLAALGHDIGALYEKQNKLDEAMKYATNGLKLALEIGENHLVEEAYSGMENIYVKKKMYKEAFENRLKYDEIEINLRSADNGGKIKQLQMQYDFESKHVADSLQLAKDKEVSSVKLQKQKILTYGGMLGILISSMLLFFVYRNYKNQRIANQNLTSAQNQIIKNEKLAAFGTMASRMSHEILNPLNFVTNFSELSQELAAEINEATTEDEKKRNAEMLKANLQKINVHSKRAVEIVKELQERSTKGTAQEFFEKN